METILDYLKKNTVSVQLNVATIVLLCFSRYTRLRESSSVFCEVKMILEWTINKHGGSLQVTKVQRKSSRQSIVSTGIYFNNTAKKSSGATQILCSISCNWDESSSVEKWLGAVDFLYEIQTVEFMWVWQQQWSCSFVKAKTLLPCFGILLSLSVGLLWYDYRAN